jgi:hypothetical protein
VLLHYVCSSVNVDGFECVFDPSPRRSSRKMKNKKGMSRDEKLSKVGVSLSCGFGPSVRWLDVGASLLNLGALSLVCLFC